MAIVAVAVGSGLVWFLMWVGSVKEHKSAVTKFMDEIRDDIKKILRRLPAAPVGAGSPVALTDYGEEIAKAIDATEWVRIHADTIRATISGKAAYEIKEISFEYAREQELSPSMREVMYEYGYSGDHVRAVLGVVLRDQLLGGEPAVS